MKRITSLLACAGLLALPMLAQAQAGGLNPNCDFSLGDQVSGDITDWDRNPPTSQANPLMDGAYSQWDNGAAAMGVDLGSPGTTSATAMISQDVTLGAGNYTVSFDVDVLTVDATGGDQLFVTWSGGQYIATPSNGSFSFTTNHPGGLSALTASLVPNGNNGDDDSDTQILIDNLCINEGVIPEPGSWAAMAMGGFGLLRFARRRK
jgi:hypothetical protein